MSTLSLKSKVLAALMRRLPTGVRRVEMWWRHLYRIIGGGGFSPNPALDSLWPKRLQAPIRGRRHKMRMYLDLSDWSERRAFFSGQYYQLALELIMEKLLDHGDQYIDIGANIGMTCLIAARRIGPTGRGLAVEPNPLAMDRLRMHLEKNGLHNFQIMACALSDHDGEADLLMHDGHIGTASLISDRATATIVARVQMRRPEILDSWLFDRPVLIKIDVEGYEYRILASLQEVLARTEVALVVEVNDEWLRKAGGSADELYALLVGQGFVGARFSVMRGRWRHRLVIAPTSRGNRQLMHDALFIKPGSIFDQRLQTGSSTRIIKGAYEG